jgi:hypothetical protein
MTPQEKALQLIDAFDEYAESRINEIGEFDKKYCCKVCALIVVDEILNNNNKIPGNVSGLHTIENTYYWQEVKQEIENL